jgi:hypothetical protein
VREHLNIIAKKPNSQNHLRLNLRSQRAPKRWVTTDTK